MLNLNTLLIGSANPAELTKFYSQVLESQPAWGGEVGEFVGFNVGAGYLVIGPHSKVQGKNTNPERIIFNFETPDVNSEFERIKNIAGASVVQEPYSPEESSDMTLATLADVDGNYFQLASPMKM